MTGMGSASDDSTHSKTEAVTYGLAIRSRSTLPAHCADQLERFFVSPKGARFLQYPQNMTFCQNSKKAHSPFRRPYAGWAYWYGFEEVVIDKMVIDN